MKKHLFSSLCMWIYLVSTPCLSHAGNNEHINWLNANTDTTVYNNTIQKGSYTYYFSNRGISWDQWIVRWNKIQAVGLTKKDRVYVSYIAKNGDYQYLYITPKEGVSGLDVKVAVYGLANDIGEVKAKWISWTLEDEDDVHERNIQRSIEQEKINKESEDLFQIVGGIILIIVVIFLL